MNLSYCCDYKVKLCGKGSTGGKRTGRVAHGTSVMEDAADGAGGQRNDIANLPVGKVILLVQDDNKHDLLVLAEAVEPGILPVGTAGGDVETGDVD